MNPKRISIPIPQAARVSFGAMPGRPAAAIISHQVQGWESRGFITRPASWDKVLEPEQPQAPYNHARKARRTLVLASDRNVAPSTPPRQATALATSTRCATDLDGLIRGLHEYRGILTEPMPEHPALQHYYWSMRVGVPRLLDHANAALSIVAELLCDQLRLTLEQLEIHCRSAALFGHLVAYGETVRPHVLQETATFCLRLGLVIDSDQSADSRGGLGGICRISVPADAGLRAALEGIAGATRLSLGTVGYAAIVAHQLDFPFGDLVKRMVLRRPLLKLAHHLVALDWVIRDYNQTVEQALPARSGAVVPSHPVNVRKVLSAADRAQIRYSEQDLHQFLVKLRKVLDAVESKRRMALRAVIGLLAGRAEINVRALIARRSKIEPFCVAVTKNVQPCHKDLLSAAALTQRLWWEGPDLESVHRQMHASHWKDLENQFPA